MLSSVTSIFIFTLISPHFYFFFFFNDTATTEIYTLSLHDALPICPNLTPSETWSTGHRTPYGLAFAPDGDRKSTRLNSSHVRISYAVFCLKKKKKKTRYARTIVHGPARGSY